MYPYILCTCGRSIGDLYELYIAMRRELIDEAGMKEYLPIYAQEIDSKIKTSEILDNLNLHKLCCRTKMITFIPFYSVY